MIIMSVISCLTHYHIPITNGDIILIRDLNHSKANGPDDVSARNLIVCD